MKEEMEAEAAANIVQFGDASIAAPFTSKLSSIECCSQIIKQGRCTLIITLLMFKILGINALVWAYCQSVLYLDGVKASDGQATFQAILLTGLFLFISKAKPLTLLSKERPLRNIFNIYVILSVVAQFAIHLGCLLNMVRMAKDATPAGMPGSWDAVVDTEKEFEPSLLNTSVWMMQMGMQTANFVVNYRGHPFMQSIMENKPFLYSIVIPTVVLLAMIMDWMPEASEYLMLVPFEDEYRVNVLKILAFDFFGTLLADRILLFLLGTSKLRTK